MVLRAWHPLLAVHSVRWFDFFFYDENELPIPGEQGARLFSGCFVFMTPATRVTPWMGKKYSYRYQENTPCMWEEAWSFFSFFETAVVVAAARNESMHRATCSSTRSLSLYIYGGCFLLSLLL